MHNRSAFHVDCNPVIPECGFDCPKCIHEIESTLTSMDGIHSVHVEDEKEGGRLIVEHDAARVSADRLLDVLKGLPSFYEGFFAPTMATP